MQDTLLKRIILQGKAKNNTGNAGGAVLDRGGCLLLAVKDYQPI